MRRSIPLLALVLAGCTILAPRPDRTRWFVLKTLAAPPAARPAATGAVRTVAIGPIGLPAYLERSGLATRVGEARVVYAAGDRWAEPLSAGFTRVLAEDLALLLAPRRLVVYPDVIPTPDATLRVEVLRFEADEAGRAELGARWTLIEGAADTGATNETWIAEDAGAADAEAVVVALSRAVARFAEEVAAAVRRADRLPGS